ncbi:hypothetical protein I317_02920 [Kwoniella heveanensis CBS 569]|nr:hypothetical protein I317_02920 [Kwoniella heveanensis CBS 569]
MAHQVEIPHILRENSIFQSFEPLKHLIDDTGTVALPATDEIVSSLHNFIQASSVVQGSSSPAMVAALKLETALLSTEQSPGRDRDDSLLDRIENLINDKFKAFDDRFKTFDDKFKTFDEQITAIRTVVDKMEWREQETAARARNRSRSAAGIPWIAVPSHVHGRSAPGGVKQPLKSIADVIGLKGTALGEWLRLYEIEETGTLADQKRTLIDFLSGVSH